MNLLETGDIEAIKSGVARGEAEGSYVCLTCGRVFTQGEVYRFGERYFDASRAAHAHTAEEHGDRLEQLLLSGSRYLTVTDHQKRLLRLMAEGRTDAEIAAETGATAATVRRQRFTFREKAKAARMYLAVYELADKTKSAQAQSLLPIHEGVTMMDDRFVITEQENQRYLKNAFSSLEPPRLKALPVKEKKKVAVLNHIAKQFAQAGSYTEKEVNAILKAVFPDDYVALRRYLIEYGYLDRVSDGSRYWVRQ